MIDLNQLRAKVEEAVSSRLKEHLGQIQREIAEQVARDLEPVLSGILASRHSDSGGGQSSAASGVLNSTIASIQESSAQADILRALLEGVAAVSPRAALFVVRGNTLAGWQARGFSDDNIRGISLDGSSGLAARAINGRSRASAAAAEFDSAFVERQGNPWDGNATVFPLVVKDKVAAVLYCDSGREPNRQADYSGVEVLTRFSCLWLEHAAVKKHLGPSAPEVAAPAQPTTAPSQAHGHVQQSPPPVSAPVPDAALDHLPAEEQEVHKKARRFAKLLVDEIKLYNQSKVAEGKQNRDLYKVLREDIEKSRATYDKRYGGTPAASGRYFDSEVVRILADNDRSLLGSDFPG